MPSPVRPPRPSAPRPPKPSPAEAPAPIHAYDRTHVDAPEDFFAAAGPGTAAPSSQTYLPQSEAPILEAERLNDGLGANTVSLKWYAKSAPAEFANLTSQGLVASPPSGPLVPEDGSARIRAFHMVYQDAHTGDRDFIRSMARIGRLEGFRVAGVFFNPLTGGQTMNILNGESGTNPSGGKYYIGLGGDPRAERSVVAALTEVEPKLKVYLLDAKLTAPTLNWNGGIGCRSKAEATS